MAESIAIQFIQGESYNFTDRMQFEIDSVVQADLVSIWKSNRKHMGYGFGAYGGGEYGQGEGVGYGEGAYGQGGYGRGERILTHNTRAKFVAGDYSVRARVIDEVGNAGSWSASNTIEHRPLPPAPTNLSITSSTLTFSWSDP